MQNGWSSRVLSVNLERSGRRVLIAVAGGALAIGVAAWAAGFGQVAAWIWEGQFQLPRRCCCP